MARAGLKYLAGALLATAVGVTFSTAYAQGAAQDDKPSHKSEGGPEGRPPHEPPPQAYDDCKGKKEGDAVTIHPPGHDSVPATCESSPKGLFARPEHPPRDGGPHGDHGPADGDNGKNQDD